LRQAAPARRLAAVGARLRRADRPRRDRLFRLRRLPARDREARQPDHPAPRAARARAKDGVRIERVADGVFASVAEQGDVAVGNAGFVALGGETLVFDTPMSLHAARRLREAAEAHGTARTVLLSHWHGDHVYGAAEFESAHVVATDRTAELMHERTSARLAQLKQTPLEEFAGTAFAEIAESELPGLEL